MTEITVDADTAEITVLMNKAEAVSITEEIRQSVASTCFLVKEAHDKQAWKAMGYGSWAAYSKAEFNVGKSRSYQLVKYAEAIVLTSEVTGLSESTIVDLLPEGTSRTIPPDALKAAVTEAFDAVRTNTAIKTRSELLAAVLDELTEPEPDDEAENSDDADASLGSSDEQRQDPAPGAAPNTPTQNGDASSAADAGSDSDEVTGQHAAHDLDAGGAGSAASTPALPDDWRQRIGNAAYLLRLDADLLRDAIGSDDRADLTDLRNHLNTILEEQNA